MKITKRGLVRAEADRRMEEGEAPLTAKERRAMLDAGDVVEADEVRRGYLGLPRREDDELRALRERVVRTDDEDAEEVYEQPSEIDEADEDVEEFDEEDDEPVAPSSLEVDEEDAEAPHYSSELERSIAEQRARDGQPIGGWERYVLEHGTLPPAGTKLAPPMLVPIEDEEPEPEPEVEISGEEMRAAARKERRARRKTVKVAGIAFLGLLALEAFRRSSPDRPKTKPEVPRIVQYVVQAGDTPRLVATKFGITPEVLLGANAGAALTWSPGLVVSVPT